MPLVLFDEVSEWEMAAVLKVSETSYDEWEPMKQSWIGAVPSGLEVPTRARSKQRRPSHAHCGSAVFCLPRHQVAMHRMTMEEAVTEFGRDGVFRSGD